MVDPTPAIGLIIAGEAAGDGEREMALAQLRPAGELKQITGMFNSRANALTPREIFETSC